MPDTTEISWSSSFNFLGFLPSCSYIVWSFVQNSIPQITLKTFFSRATLPPLEITTCLLFSKYHTLSPTSHCSFPHFSVQGSLPLEGWSFMHLKTSRFLGQESKLIFLSCLERKTRNSFHRKGPGTLNYYNPYSSWSSYNPQMIALTIFFSRCLRCCSFAGIPSWGLLTQPQKLESHGMVLKCAVPCSSFPNTTEVTLLQSHQPPHNCGQLAAVKGSFVCHAT